MMSVMSETETRDAFITAACVLLVMPLLYIVGLASLYFVMSVSPWAETRGLMVLFAAVWAVIVVISVLMLSRRLIRRLPRD
jgi:hypothetical protein